MQIRDFVRKLLGERNTGRLNYLLNVRSPSYWRGPFNDQRGRQNIWLAIVKHLEFSAVVETGTFRGTTSLFLAESGLPVYTVEVSPRYYECAAMRLRRHRGRIHVTEADSRTFLTKLAENPSFPKSSVFFYLDAHWREDLPLREEVTIIFRNWANSVAMIDDFCVPSTDYGYDDYGPGKQLTLQYLQPVLSELRLIPFFPSFGPECETGSKRGCVVLCREGRIADRLRRIDLLSAYLPGAGGHRG